MVFEWIENIVEPKHIVIIDDDKNILRIYTEVLEKKRYHVTAAANFDELGGLEGLDEIEEEKGEIYAFLIDLFIKPGPSGIEIMKILRGAEFECPICFISARRCNVKEEQHLTGLAEDLHFLQKPISPKALLHKVAEMTGNI